MIILETDRLIIRDHVMEDLESHHTLFSDERYMYYLQDIKTHSFEESTENLKNAIEEIEKTDRRCYFLRIENKEKEHIGEIGYTVTDFTPVGKLVHLGYFTRSQYWGQGYTTEALKEIMSYAFMKNDVFKISTGCLKENVGSEKVMRKCGMLKEEELKLSEWHDGKMKDRVIYRLLREEYLLTNPAFSIELE